MNVLRFFFGCIYIIGGIANIVVTMVRPSTYMDFADTAFIPFYKHFLIEYFYYNIPAFTIPAAFYQITIGLLIICKDMFVKIGLVGAVIFSLLIIPLGQEQLPNIIFVAFMIYLLRKNYHYSFIDLIRHSIGINSGQTYHSEN